MINYIKKHGVPEQYPIMMLVGMARWSLTNILQMAKGHKMKWFWHTWDYWEVFEDHDLNVHYKCWRFFGIEREVIFEAQPASDFPHPFDCFSYNNRGHATYQNGKGIMKIGYPSGEHYPKGTRVERDLKFGRAKPNNKSWIAWIDESKFINGLGFKTEDESENNSNEGQ